MQGGERRGGHIYARLLHACVFCLILTISSGGAAGEGRRGGVGGERRRVGVGGSSEWEGSGEYNGLMVLWSWAFLIGRRKWGQGPSKYWKVQEKAPGGHTCVSVSILPFLLVTRSGGMVMAGRWPIAFSPVPMPFT